MEEIINYLIKEGIDFREFDGRIYLTIGEYSFVIPVGNLTVRGFIVAVNNTYFDSLKNASRMYKSYGEAIDLQIESYIGVLKEKN